jgi:uncharacterized phage infection (PIP) family protein YhgE
VSERKMNRHYNFLVLGLVLGGMLTACSGESKTVQCQKFIKVHGEVEASLSANPTLSQLLNRQPKNLKEFQQLTKDYSKAYTQLATGIDKAVKLIEVLSVQDDKLKTLKTEYLAATGKAGEITRKLASISDAQSKVTDTKDKNFQKLNTELTQASQNLGAVGKEEKSLIASLNTYCGNKPK